MLKVRLGFFFFKQKTGYEWRISDWSSDVCSSDLRAEYRRHRDRQGKQPLPEHAICGHCGTDYQPLAGTQKYCTSQCRLLGSDDRDRSPRLCHECGATFAPEYGNKRRHFCSAACLRRSMSRVKRKLERARLRTAKVEAVDPIKVFDRDGWRCHLCRRKTPRRLRGTYDARAPELDHIQPLSCGGDHIYANPACAGRARSEERPVGKGGVSPGRSRWSR